MEGNQLEFNSPDWYVNIKEFNKDFDKKDREDAYSNGDFVEDLKEKIELKDHTEKIEKGIFEKVEYLMRLFPSKRE